MPPTMETEAEAMIEWVLKNAASIYFYTRFNRMLLTSIRIWKVAKKKYIKKQKSIRIMEEKHLRMLPRQCTASGLGNIWSTLSQALCIRHFTIALLI